MEKIREHESMVNKENQSALHWFTVQLFAIILRLNSKHLSFHCLAQWRGRTVLPSACPIFFRVEAFSLAALLYLFYCTEPVLVTFENIRQFGEHQTEL